MIIQNKFPFSFINIAGATCSGKTTLIKQFIARFPEQLEFSKSHTTRDLAPDETDLYEKISVEEFQRMISADEFFEWNQLESNGVFYGTSRKEYLRIKNLGKTAITDLDNNGAAKVRNELGEDFFSAFLEVFPKELLRRMLLPGSRVRDNPEKRLAYGIKETEFARKNVGIIHNVLLPYNFRTANQGVTILNRIIRKSKQLLVVN